MLIEQGTDPIHLFKLPRLVSGIATAVVAVAIMAPVADAATIAGADAACAPHAFSTVFAQHPGATDRVRCPRGVDDVYIDPRFNR